MGKQDCLPGKKLANTHNLILHLTMNKCRIHELAKLQLLGEKLGRIVVADQIEFCCLNIEIKMFIHGNNVN